jgi:pilus assembly protein CpaF
MDTRLGERSALLCPPAAWRPAPDPGIVRHVQDRVLAEFPAALHRARQEGDVPRQHLVEVIEHILVRDNLASGRAARETLAVDIAAEIAGLGPIDALMADPSITEVMVNGPDCVYVELGGRLTHTPVRFRDASHLVDVIGRIVAAVGRRVDQASPYVDARLPDGSRVNAIIPPLAVTGPTLTVRKFARCALTVGDLLAHGTMSQEMTSFFELCVRARLNLLISGGAGSGKTTTLNALSAFIPDERVVTIEDAAELRLHQAHVISLETRPPNLEGRGAVTIRHLVRNALRMRPDRIIVGECRGVEAFDMLQAMNTGHEGSMTTIHANGPHDALLRLENMALMAGEGVPLYAIRDQVRRAIDVVVHQARFRDGSRRITSVCLVPKDEPELGPGPGPGTGSGPGPGPGPVSGPGLSELFCFNVHGYDENGALVGKHVAAPRSPLPPHVRAKIAAAGLEPAGSGVWGGDGP